MKKFLLSLMVFASVLSMNSCSDSSANQENVNPQSKEMAMKDYGRTVPVGIDKEDGKFKVSFILSAQPYEIKDTKENEAYISMISQAVKNESPVHVFLKSNSNEIVKVESPTLEDINFFKSALTKEVRAEKGITNKLASVIPDLATLNSLFTQIKNQSCGTSTASSPCITFRYPVDGCYARAHKMRQILNNAGYECEKQFVYGNLRATTGTCCVSWVYHVAILVSFKNASGVVEKRIIDPSLVSTGPITDTAWRAACTNSTCGSASVSSYANTAGNVYYRNPAGSLLYDNNLVNTNCTLTAFSALSGCSAPVPSTAHCGF
ncbi:protein-glutamine glutaminase [Chryseobacterium tructae]|uniref:Protein-glutamine glutaminase n=1 Tax=Chryseobacterium tructae TaxID=1037380 RepID=A0ABV7Y084_9FLAO|nr:protein-glutamine glutaminase [Chryseobacterium tructae]MDN3693986.1 protein-glutamine glutaminase [Chryseobacterium tructae]